MTYDCLLEPEAWLGGGGGHTMGGGGGGTIYGEISSIRGEPMSIRNQPCPRRDGGMEVDGDMEVGSIKIKTLSIKINTQPVPKALASELFARHALFSPAAQSALSRYLQTACF